MGRIAILNRLSPEMIAEVKRLKAAGNTDRTCMQYLGISKDTWYEWMKKGEERRGTPYADFADTIKRAEAECMARNVGFIQTAAITTWQAAAWWLERRYPDEYGLKSQVNMNMTAVKIVDNIDDDDE